MSEEVIEDAVVIPEEGIAENIPADDNGGITAFIIVKRPSGDWYATADLSTTLTVDRQASLDDIKHGCQDIVDSMNQSAIAYQVLDLIKPLISGEQ